MLGLNADQGRAMYEDIATLAAKACNWDKKRRIDELDALRTYSDSFRI
jgi:hypothetical protein